MDLNELNISQARKGLREKKFSSQELVKVCLEQIKKIDSKIKAFITVCKKEALEKAKKADNLLSQQKPNINRQPLLGIPIAIKDIYCTKGVKTTAGSKVLEDYIPVYDATAVRRLKEAGAIIIGKTNMDAWAHGSSGENSDFFPTKNPWDLKRTPGGSSSGSAAAVASNQCLAATGTDTGGSIRLPAAFCNLVGLKPTYGRVSRFGVIAMASSLDCIGHLTKTVEDSALLLSVTAGRDKFDATSSDKTVEAYPSLLKTLHLKKIKIGIPKEYFSRGLNKEIKNKIMEAIRLLGNYGCEIEEVSLPHTDYATAVYYIIQPAEVSSNLGRYDGIRFGQERKEFGDEAKRRIMLGTYTLSAGYYQAYYLKAMKVRSLIIHDFEKVFRQVDILIAPVSSTLPFKIGEKADNPLAMYLSDSLTIPVSLAGLPALALSCGFSNDHLPIGMQIIGPQFSEKLLFQVGHAYEQATEWYKRRPKL